MRNSYFGRPLSALLLFLLAPVPTFLVVSVLPAAAQTSLSGDLAGNVADPSGAVIPNATVTLKNNATGATQKATTGADGNYRFSLLSPGTYTVSGRASGFQSSQTQVTVAVGTARTANLKLSLGESTQTVQVTEAEPLVQTQDANISTTFSTEQISNMPNPGNDITFMGQLAPGSVVNSTNQAANGQFGYGNFSSFGLPATSNNFTVNGTDENDPFFNINNSGATNLLLGNNEIAEDTVVSNAYTAQFGGLGGAQLNEITKSGSNKFHGNLIYWWNGRILNANDYFNNQQGVPRPFVNDNQWAASLGGPIRHDKLFFFLDTEGTRFIFPTSNQVFVPSASYQASTLASVAAANPTEVPYYQHLFSIYNNAPGASGALPYIEGGVTNPDVNTFRSNASSGANEWLLTGRVDYNISDKNRLFGRFKMDRGFQPSYTDPLNPAFDLVSTQPSYEGQMVDTYAFTPNMSNQLLIYGDYYSAIFAPPSISANESLFTGGFDFLSTPNAAGTTDTFNEINPYGFFFNGRNATQYGVADDFSWTKGAHTIRLGWNMKRDDISDFDPLEYNYPYNVADGANFGAGTSLVTIQDFPARQSDPIALYQMGAYAEDDWNVRPNFKLTLGLRLEHNSNPVCTINCFAHLSGDFYSMAAANATAASPTGAAYDSLIDASQHRTFPGYEHVAVEPRSGFNYSPNGKTVIRGGFGMFADAFPGTIADSLLFNPPNDIGFSVGGGLLDPALPGSGSQIAAAGATAFRSAFANGGSYDSISATNPNFAVPNFTSPATNVHYPTYEEYSLQVQRQFGRSTAITLGYVGNHGYHEPVQENSANAYGFGSLPATAPLPSFGQVTLVTSEASSSYSGLTATLAHREKYVTLTLNYTYSHALDEISNGGFLPFNPGNTSFPENPYDLSQNYGNADYDVRHNVTGDYVIMLPNYHRFKMLTNLWQVSGTVFYHTGFPYSVTDVNTSTTLNNNNYYGTLFANQLAPQATHACSASSVLNFTTGSGSPCLSSANFTTATAFGQGRRNNFFGPHYIDTDLTVQKGFAIPHHETTRFNVAAQFFNVLNHPNFAQPVSDINSPLFGLIDGTVSTPTSIFGNGLGGDASPRIIQLKGTFQF